MQSRVRLSRSNEANHHVLAPRLTHPSSCTGRLLNFSTEPHGRLFFKKHGNFCLLGIVTPNGTLPLGVPWRNAPTNKHTHRLNSEITQKKKENKTTQWLRTRKPRKDLVGKRQEHRARRYVSDSQSKVHAPWFALDETLGPCQ